MFFLSETFLDSFVLPNNEKLYRKRYKFIRADTPSHNKNGCMGICYKKLLNVRSVEVKSLNKCVILEVPIKIKRIFVVPLYKCHHQMIFVKLNLKVEYPL